jgi:hypothetical protein
MCDKAAALGDTIKGTFFVYIALTNISKNVVEKNLMTFISNSVLP